MKQERVFSPSLFFSAVDAIQMEIKLECLDNLTDLLKRFGREVESEVSG